MLGSSLVVVVLRGYSIVTWQYSRYKCNLVEAQGCNDEAAIHRRLAQICRKSLGTKGWVLGSKVDGLALVSISSQPSVCLWGCHARGQGSPAATSAQSCGASHAGLAAWQPGWPHPVQLPTLLPLQYRAGEPFKLSACRGKHGTVPTHTAVCYYPAALPAPARPGYMCMYSYESGSSLGEVEDTCKTVPLGEWREAKGVFMHRRPLQYIRPQTRPFANPQTTDCSIEGAIICFFVSIHFC